jgi:hypothetical protein
VATAGIVGAGPAMTAGEIRQADHQIEQYDEVRLLSGEWSRRPGSVLSSMK